MTQMTQNKQVGQYLDGIGIFKFEIFLLLVLFFIFLPFLPFTI